MSDNEKDPLKPLTLSLKLSSTRTALLGKIDRLYAFSNLAAADATKELELSARIEELSNIIADFECVQLEIEIFYSQIQSSELDKQYAIRTEFENKVYAIKTTAAHLKSLRVNHSNLSSNSMNANNSNPRVKLPELHLSTFSGSLKDWTGFADLFKSLIHNNTSLSNVEKFQYLKHSLVDEPFDLIKNLPVVDLNYDIAWKILVDKYENRRLIISQHIENILDLPSFSGSPKLAQLSSFLSQYKESIAALKALGVQVDDWNDILVVLLSRKVDKSVRTRWEFTHTSKNMPDIQDFVSFLEKQLVVLETVSETDRLQTHKSYSNKHNSSSQPKLKTFFGSCSASRENSHSCPRCGQSHALTKCSDFLEMNPYQRFDFVKSQRLCINCLGLNHRILECKSKHTCNTCHSKHHSLLHFDSKRPTEQNNTSSDGKAITLYSEPLRSKKPTVLLPTILVNILDRYGKQQSVRAIIDTASQANYILESCCQRLGLSRRINTTEVLALDDKPILSARGETTCIIRSSYNPNIQFSVDCLVVSRITSNLPNVSTLTRDWHHLDNLKLADPGFDNPQTIDMLLGASAFPRIFTSGTIEGSKGTPTAFNTVFGWVVMGDILSEKSSTSVNTFFLTNDCTETLENALGKFWEIEEVVTPTKPLSKAEEQAETLFESTTYRDSSGRYIVNLPFRVEKPNLGASFEIARSCYSSLVRRLKSNPSLRKQYIALMLDYLKSGHMSLVKPANISDGYFIPHHCVLKPDSSTTKLRAVFNASRKTDNGISLNDTLFAGPVLQQDLTAIIARFRLWRFVLTTDVRQMYRQINVVSEHRKYQQILWNFDLNEEPNVYQLNTVTYGLNCAPFLALRTIKQLAQDEQESYPVASRTITRDMYVDDLVTGRNPLSEATELQRELSALCRAGGFELRKWSSNSIEVLKDVPVEHCAGIDDELNLTGEASLKILGLYWHPKLDVFSYKIQSLSNKCTKRAILSDIARIFDPLGWLAPVTFFAKRIMQSLWCLQLDWDQTPPDRVTDRWESFRGQLSCLSEIRIPRSLPVQKSQIDLVGFCDASNHGYAAVVYIRNISELNEVNIHLISAKTRVAPLKRISLPRLELCGALLLAQLIRKTVEQLDIEIVNIFAFTDSSVALSWIKAEPYRWKTFVCNRVTKIQSLVSADHWKHVRSEDNPADCASRGLLPNELQNHPLWWAGPKWLQDHIENWPQSLVYPEESVDLEIAPKLETTLLLVEPDGLNLLNRFSSFVKLQRVVAYCFRFVNRCRKVVKQQPEYLTTLELNQALVTIIKMVQSNAFHIELDALSKGKSLAKPFRKLNPFLDSIGVLRVGGRLHNSFVSLSQRHPILLPFRHHITDLIIDHFHKLYLHPGSQTLQGILSQKFWIMSFRRAIRSRLASCKQCFRLNPQPSQPLMGDLPAQRVNQSKPFEIVGVDYGGPFRVVSSRIRGAKSTKAYICLFICFSTKAIHIELASDLSTDVFLAAFRRFIARRGRCSHIYSDCGTNFVGADRKLGELFSLVASEDHNGKLANSLSIEGIQWHFNPPSAPHFGGLWESNIKCIKTHLLRVVGEQILTYEELNTVLIEIEALLNSRPLCHLSSDPNDFSALTPGHFLTHEPLIRLPDCDYSEVELNRLDRWQLVQRIQQDVWKRWHKEYLHTLQQRAKWHSNEKPIVEGSLVVIKDDLAPPLRWKLGRISRIFPGADGTIRVAEVVTSSGIFRRPVVKLCPLPSQ